MGNFGIELFSARHGRTESISEKRAILPPTPGCWLPLSVLQHRLTGFVSKNETARGAFFAVRRRPNFFWTDISKEKALIWMITIVVILRSS